MSWSLTANGCRLTLSTETPVPRLPLLPFRIPHPFLLGPSSPLKDIEEDEGDVQVISLSVQSSLRIITGTHTLTRILIHIRDGGINPGYHPFSCRGLPSGYTEIFGQHFGSNLPDLWLHCTRRLGFHRLFHQTPGTRRPLRNRQVGWTKIPPLKLLFRLHPWTRQLCLRYHRCQTVFTSSKTW